MRSGYVLTVYDSVSWSLISSMNKQYAGLKNEVSSKTLYIFTSFAGSQLCHQAWDLPHYTSQEG